MIENYNSAITDNQRWCCHHRLEMTLGLTYIQMINANLYYKRPAEELILMPIGEHSRMHKLGKNRPEDICNIISERTCEAMKDPEIRKKCAVWKGKHSPMLGKRHSEESKKKMSESKKGRIPWNKGKHPSELTRQKLRDSHKGKPSAVKGTHWYNNGKINVRRSECPEGFVQGVINEKEN